MPPKLLIIGLDSATYDVIRPAAELGLVPHIARLMAEGTSLTLLSSRPPLTPVAWTTMMTGVSAGRHGILDFRELTPGTYFLERSAGTLCRSKQLWRLLSDAGLTVGAYNFPWTDTRGPINGFLIGGKDLAGTPARCQPRALAKELQAVFGLSALDDLPPSPTDGQYDMEELRAHVYSLFGVAGHLLSRQPLDAFGVNLMATDHVQHHVVGLPSADGRPHQTLLGLYQAVDEAIGELLAHAADDTIVVVVSDHGAGPFRERINVYAVLRELGFAAFRDGLPAWDAPPAPATAIRRRRRRTLLRPGKAVLRPLKSLKRRLMPLWRRTGVANRLFRHLDWSRTRVFCWGPFPGFRVNVVGREPRGLVQPSDYEATCDELVAGLLAFRHPRTGEPLFDWAAKTDDIYPGLPAQGTPDVLALTAGHAYGSDIHVPYPDAPVILQPEDVARFNPAAAHLTGNHRPEGVCILRGPGVKQGAVPAEPATLLDFLPTVLHLLGLAIPEGLEGRVIESALEQPVGDRAVYTDLSLAVEAAGSVQDYSGEEAEQVEERLRDLGYLE